QTSSTFNVTTGIYINGPEPTGERFRDGYRQQTNIGLTRYIDGFLGASHQLKTGFENWYGWGSDGFQIFNDTRLRYTSDSNGQNLVPSEVYGWATPLTQRSRMRNFAGFVQDRATYSRVTVNLGVRYSYYDGNIPAQTGGGGRWFPVTNYPEIDPGYKWSTFAPRTGVVIKLTEDGKNVAKASYSRYYDSMYTSEFNNINPNIISTTNIPVVYAWKGDLNGDGIVQDNELGNLKSQYIPKSNTIDPNLKDPKNDEIMFSFQREVANNVSFSADWIQRWFKDKTVDENIGIPTSAYTPAAFTDFGPDNIKGTADDRQVTFYNVSQAYLGKDAFLHTNCGNNSNGVSCTQVYKALELSVTKRMSNKWQMQGSYVWSKMFGDRVLDYTNPNDLVDSMRNGYDANDQTHAFKLLGSYQAPFGVTLGANYQALTGLPIDRTLSVANTQGTTSWLVDERGVFRASFLNLLSVRADKTFTINGSRRFSVIAEVHNLINSAAGQSSYGSVTRGNASQAAFDAARATVSYFGRVQEIVAPRLLKLGFKFSF
ncbi:MAG TPA: hypothetical protein VHU82_00945, partial [Vicinamibacterales bacterium]|nr:hypothetical protein [Vicinamibacterales bacterium]